MMTDYDKAMTCYESALRHNPYSVVALSQIASLCRGREQFGRAVDYFKRILAIQENNGETWAALGHCYLMMDNLQEAYQAYQQALYHLSNPKVKNSVGYIAMIMYINKHNRTLSSGMVLVFCMIVMVH